MMYKYTIILRNGNIVFCVTCHWLLILSYSVYLQALACQLWANCQDRPHWQEKSKSDIVFQQTTFSTV